MPILGNGNGKGHYVFGAGATAFGISSTFLTKIKEATNEQTTVYVYRHLALPELAHGQGTEQPKVLSLNLDLLISAIDSLNVKGNKRLANSFVHIGRQISTADLLARSAAAKDRSLVEDAVRTGLQELRELEQSC